MATLNLSLPDDVLTRLVDEARSRGLASPEDLVRELVDQELRHPAARAADEQLLEDELVRRLDEDEPVDMDEADFRSIREEVENALLHRRKS
jgi:hypothetical protein